MGIAKRGSRSTDHAAVELAKGARTVISSFAKEVRADKRNLDGDTCYRIQEQICLMRADLSVLEAHLEQTKRVRTIDQPTALTGGGRRKRRS